MQSGFFWKNWASPFREIYTFLFLLFIGGICCALYFHFTGIESILGWSTLAQSEPIQIAIEAFKVGPFSLGTSAESQVFSQKYLGNFPEINEWSYYLFLIITTLCFNVLIAIITTLPRFYYFVGTSLLVIVLVNLKLELLLLFGSTGKLGLIIALVLFLPATYIFNSFKTNVSFGARLATFIGLTAIFSIIIWLFAEVNSPFFHLASYGLINPLIISLVFILMIAHEIVAAFIYFITKSANPAGTKKNNNLLHFSIITVIYLANLFLAYLYETNIIVWDFPYVNLFLLLTASAILGLLSYQLREYQYESMFKFRPVGALFYISMAICCFTTLGHFFATGNDPAIEVFRDVIIYSHLGYGIIFVVYILANFIDPLKRGLPVYKVLYKPTGMPYFTFRFAGLIAFIAFTVKSNYEVPVNQSFGAYYNSIGDLHKSDNQIDIAKHFYTEGANFAFNNHKANYALATIAHEQNKSTDAIERYEKAIAKNPSPQGFINLSSIHFDRDDFFDAVFTLQTAAEKFPNNGYILNNLGLLYSKTRVLDTAAFYMDKATQISETQATAGSNILTLLALNDIPVHPDSVIAEYDIQRDPISINNTIVLKNKLGVVANERFQPQDSALSYLQSSILYNIAFNHLFQEDSLDTQVVRAYSTMPANLNYRESLQLVAAFNLEKNGDLNQSFRQLNWLANSSQLKSGEYFNTLGMWALKHDVPYVAKDYFEYAQNRDYKNATLNLAIALTENLDREEAITLWQELLLEKNRNTQIIASNILSILTWEPSMLESDKQRYYFLKYRTTYQDTVSFKNIVDEISDADLKAQSILDMAQKLWRQDLTDEAVSIYSRLAGLQITDGSVYERAQWFELKMLAAQGNIRGLATKINDGMTFGADRQIEKNYYTGLLSEASGDTTAARQHYSLIAYKNPFFPESVIAAANFYNVTDRFEAYNILLSALEINPQSIRLLKAYVLQCARIENESYAQISLEKLQELISPKAYREFYQEYNAVLEKTKREAENF
ncbi:hypothetical protein E1176_18135 [Fulvivirga sp. RKSG066]|uniref:hypothetical protein n=1 Tax=Fulvivirga aurantia TaxID=2529383 RepID=UPI0012BC7CEE|nr:hypothetical protein [Fulvivirga aurantia]MTI22955.1 hypothetical protein [Fulvivirga aurantia]